MWVALVGPRIVVHVNAKRPAILTLFGLQRYFTKQSGEHCVLGHWELVIGEGAKIQDLVYISRS